MKSRYFILARGKWHLCAKAQTLTNYRLEYVLEDGSFGIVPANKWVAIHPA